MNRKEITEQLLNSGVHKGAIVLLHSSLASIGKVEGGADAVIDGFLDAIGPEGTLLVPVFGSLGIIPDTLKKRPGALVSPCPVGTLAGIGPAAAELFQDHWKPISPHAEGTPFFRLKEKHGFICLLGVDQDRNTALHGIEAQLRLPYLGDVTCDFTTPDGQKMTKTWKYYPGPHRNFIGLDRRLRLSGAMTVSRLGNAQLRVIDAAKMWDLAAAFGKADPAFVLCDNPNCPDCVEQRAAIFASRIKEEECFTLAASARLAGRYVPEMIENLKACGVSAVELDCIQGEPAMKLSAAKLQAVAAEFAEAGIAVNALRCPVSPDDPAALAAKLAAAKISTVILPASAPTDVPAIFARSGVTAVFSNRATTPKMTVAAAANAKCGICFDPAEFAACGYAPFTVYRNDRFIRHTCRLDLNDATRDGKVTRLAQGRAEIKEIISILRCQNFTGVFTLGGGSGYPGTLKEAVADFTRLLNEM